MVLQNIRTDLEVLQGAWSSVSGRRAEFLVCGAHFAFHFADGDIYMGSFTLDPFARPREMDVHVTAGPAPSIGQTARCIYELTGDTLRWCTAGPGQTDRPVRFPAEVEAGFLSLVFHRKRAVEAAQPSANGAG
jgi:uncharacterized protein (TIGR03067 family)